MLLLFFLFGSDEMKQIKQLYGYSGPVMMFGRCVADNWKGETYASSAEKARSNLTYAYKINHNLAPHAKVSLPGLIKLGGVI